MGPTRLTGLACYLVSAIVCALFSVRSRQTARSAWLPASLAVLEIGFCLDLLLSGRLAIHSFLEREAIANHIYGQRSEIQIPALSVLACLVAASIFHLYKRFHLRPGALLALCGALLSIACWVTEIISFHNIDAFFYFEVRGVMVVAYLWSVFSLATALGVVLDFFLLGDSPRRGIVESATLVARDPAGPSPSSNEA